MWYTKTFYQHIMFRHSCGKCHFANTKRPSDITIADFWGWQKTGSDINKDDKGLNLVLINTEKGKQFFDAIKDKLYIIDASPEAYMQGNLRKPSSVHPKRMKFEQDYINKGFNYIIKHDYDRPPIHKLLIRKFKTLIKILVNKLLK